MKTIKYKSIFRFLIIFLVCTSMSMCQDVKFHFFERTRYSPVCAEINGTQYSSGNYEYSRRGNPFNLTIDDSGFLCYFSRTITAGDNSVWLRLDMRVNESFELNKDYRLGTDDSYARVSYFSDGVKYMFTSTEGYVRFSECKGLDTPNGPYSMSGSFEFIAFDSDNNLTINVSNGTFADLYF